MSNSESGMSRRRPSENAWQGAYNAQHTQAKKSKSLSAVRALRPTAHKQLKANGTEDEHYKEKNETRVCTRMCVHECMCTTTMHVNALAQCSFEQCSSQASLALRRRVRFPSRLHSTVCVCAVILEKSVLYNITRRVL